MDRASPRARARDRLETTKPADGNFDSIHRFYAVNYSDESASPEHDEAEHS